VAHSDFENPPDMILNRVGYDLLAEQNLQEAKKIFKANCNLFPEIANTWDSLGEICMELGENKNAIRYYQKSLELNPQNNNARERIKILEEQETE
jgi:tetratricopeptide (TPR) repeat protein